MGRIVMLKKLLTAAAIAVCFASAPVRGESPSAIQTTDQSTVTVEDGGFGAYARYHHRHWRYHRYHRHHRHHWWRHHHRHHGHHWGWHRGHHRGWFRHY
jgi:hypothetical protein